MTNDQQPTTNDGFPMRLAYLDCFSGISGDMFLGALVDAGVPPQILEDAVAALDIGARLEISRVVRSGISATKVDVWSNGEKDMPREQFLAKKIVGHEHGHQHDHGHDHAHHSHDHPHDDHHHNDHHHDHPQAKTAASAPHGRHLTEIRAIISRSSISESAKKTAIAIFEALGHAEAKIHATTIDKVHFHEVGAVDAMVDIVCAAVGVETLGIDEIICSPLNVGGGTVQCAHGTLPVPAPATVELLKDAPVYSSGAQVELVTPTGAAIVKTLACRFGTFPQIKIEQSGYGAGSRDLPGQPNVLRLTIGEAANSGMPHACPEPGRTVSPPLRDVGTELLTVLEANLDDLNPQVFGYVIDRLIADGALDAFGVPVQMKKNRPGTLLTVLCKPEDAARLAHLIFTETTTLGVRRRDEVRHALARRWENVRTPWGEVRIKIASMNGTVTNFAPEYEDCRRIAEAQHVPLKTVMQEAARAYLAEAKG